MLKNTFRTLALVAILGASWIGKAEAATADGSKMQFNFTEDGKNYIRFLTWHQIWGRYIQNNPGTLVSGRALENQMDVGIRRSRFLLFGRVADRLTLVFHFGINNQTFNNGKKPQLYVHDVWTEFDVAPTYFSLGAGLHYWNGVSRMTNWSTIKFLTLDAPILNWPTIEASDQFARQLGVYAKGKIDKLDYRISLNRPFNTGSPTPGTAANYNPGNNSPSFAGYLFWEFMDDESNTLPYLPGTYIGEKSVFNIGAGWYWHPKAMYSVDEMGAVQKHDQLAVAADVFFDAPLGEGAGALTAYATFYHLDFGPNNIRNIGIMNLGTGGSSLNGAGNAYPIIGTGEHFYVQAGYLLPLDLDGTKLQPYVAGQFSKFEARDSLAIIPEVGFNWFIHGHSAKVSFVYRARPVFTLDTTGAEAKSTVDGYRSEAIIQTQLFY
ncbi:MAG: hypothetical protein KC933_18650 [Myxococcales bacterium]|nr:hypothetical protein [Myxococcales bacterium]MCB9648605.1 hypothetical protein [Deltaproteobacteria bacterium]